MAPGSKQMNTQSNILPTTLETADIERRFLMRVYAWMALALLISGLVAFSTAVSPQLILGPIMRLPGGIMILFFAQLALVMGLSFGLRKMSPGLATGLFLIYAAMTGLTLSVFLMVYTVSSIMSAFIAASATFGLCSAFGLVTNIDLSKFRGILFMALIGLVVASIVNIFVSSTVLDWVLTYVGVLIFVGLTAYDTQRLKRMAVGVDAEGGEVAKKASIMGALMLYLDFINLFLRFTRIFGRQR